MTGGARERPGCALDRPTWSPVKGSSARVSTIRSAAVVRQRFFGIPATDTDIISRNTSGRAGWNGWARLLRCGRDRSGGGFPNAGYEPHPSCGDCPLTARSRPKERPKYPEKSQMSGAVTDRPALHDALEFARSGDTLIVWELDRLARSMKQLMETIEPVPSGPDSNSSWPSFWGARQSYRSPYQILL